MYRFKNARGVALILTSLVLVGLSGMVFVFLTMAGSEIGSTGVGLRNTQAFYIAEAGRAKARWALTTGGQAVGWGESDITFAEGTYTVTTTDNGDSTYTITSKGYLPNVANQLAKRQVIEKNIPLTAGPNLSLGATIYASSEKLPSNPKENANDGDSGSSWKADSKGNAWLKLDFESSTTFDRVIYTGSNINSCTIEYSNNNVDYYPVTSAVESPTGTVNFDSVSARYLRFNMVVDSNRTAEVNELQSYNTAVKGLGQGKFSTSW